MYLMTLCAWNAINGTMAFYAATRLFDRRGPFERIPAPRDRDRRKE